MRCASDGRTVSGIESGGRRLSANASTVHEPRRNRARKICPYPDISPENRRSVPEPIARGPAVAVTTVGRGRHAARLCATNARDDSPRLQPLVEGQVPVPTAFTRRVVSDAPADGRARAR